MQHLFKILIKEVVARMGAGVNYLYCCEGFLPICRIDIQQFLPYSHKF